MKKNRESGTDEALLNAALGDEDWQALSNSVKRKALAAMGTERRKRRLQGWLGSAAWAAVLVFGVGWWLRPSPPSGAGVARLPISSAPAAAELQFISEQQMLALFPAGSCILAEVDGRKELVFFDAQKAQEGFALPQR